MSMKRTLLWVLATVSAAALADGSGLKPGLWDVTVVRQTRDGQDMTAQMAAARSQMQQAMAQMTPEQRQRMEAMMSGQDASGAAGHRICISAAMAARDKPMIDPQGRCPPSKLTQSGNKLTFEFNCTSSGINTAGTGESTVVGDTISMLVDTKVTDPHGTHAMHSETQMKYRGQDCQGMTPLDEQAKQFNAPAPSK
jgi:Protein of unknown function (DUF3617)